MERYEYYTLETCKDIMKSNDYSEYNIRSCMLEGYLYALWTNDVIDYKTYERLEKAKNEACDVYWNRAKEKVTEAHKMLFDSEIK